MHLRLTVTVLAILCVPMPAIGLQGAIVKHMTLPELVARAARIVRGTVVAREDDAVTAGGGTLPVVRYQIRVAETLKGDVASGDVIDVRMLARPKTATAGGKQRSVALQDLPELTVGQEYLFLLTQPSAVGLTATVGLRQGLFELRGRGDAEVAVNGANNVGLLAPLTPGAQARGVPTRPSAGPIPYATLAAEIRALVAK